MLHRILIAGLVVLSFGIGAMADVHRNEEHQLEADFPTKVERLTNPIKEGGKVVMAFCKDKDLLFMVAVAVEGAEELNPEHTNEFAKGLVDGLMKTRKNASITSEEELKLSDHTPTGSSFVIKHDAGSMFVWATIENNKGYFVLIEAKSEEGLKTDAVKNFQKSVKITGVK